MLRRRKNRTKEVWSPYQVTTPRLRLLISNNLIWSQFKSWTFSNTSSDIIPDPAAILRHRATQTKIVINVGGQKHEIMWKLLQQKPLSRLGKLAKAKTHEAILSLCSGYCLDRNEIYFDRDPGIFNTILNYYRQVYFKNSFKQSTFSRIVTLNLPFMMIFWLHFVS